MPYLLEQSLEAQDEDVELARGLIDLAAERATTPTERLSVMQRQQAFLMLRGDYERGLALAEEILSLTRELNLPLETFRTHIALGRALRLIGDAPAALQALHRALELGEGLSEVQRDIARTYSLMASVYRRQSDFDAAATCYDKALAIATEHHFERFKFSLLANQSLLLMDLGRFAEAKQTLEEVLAYHQDAGNRMAAASARFNLASIAHHTDDIASAVEGFEAVLQDYLELESKGREANTRLALAEIHLEQHNLPAAIAQLDAAQPVVEASGDLTHQAKYQRLRAIAQAAQGDTAAAITSTYRFIELSDALAGADVKRDIERLRAENEIARKDTELAQAERDRAIAASALDHAAAELTKTHTRYITFSVIILALGLTSLGVLTTRRRADRRILAETELARAAAEKANDLKTRLLAIASHDLKSPLSAITLCADQVVSFPDDHTYTQENVRRILEQSRRMSELITELLDLSAIESGHLDLQRQPCRLSMLTATTVATHQTQADQKGIHLERPRPAPENDPTVSVDPNRIEQVLNNLVGNALKFSPAGGTIRIEQSKNDRFVSLFIKDSGPGFTAEDLQQAFAPFCPLSARATGGESSSGLGLHIAREIAHLHGGTLDIVSAPGASAILRLQLPLA
ncbi:ATP-binding protein [Actomonas aquatica]|uniref:histidine kinase n=1 Tax=Actomonas aquatica TaxID=2866162 RepID=A0ABZ1CDG6_9BACT|nr:ATP-binding protein [Opitutus sp. WL0086]WRQ88674.1 ATP-binding protein [Opitutus sp. WL0086]